MLETIKTSLNSRKVGEDEAIILEVLESKF